MAKHKALTGKMSTFGGPNDTGVSSTEGLALCEEHEIPLFPENMFLSESEAGAPGLARRLNPESFYIAARWDYDLTPRSFLQDSIVLVTNPDNKRTAKARPIDWGPNQNTGRVCDLSPGLASYLGLTTDDVCEMVLPLPAAIEPERFGSIVISSGHGLYIRGASGVLDEVDEARRVTDAVAVELKRRKIDVKTFHDNTSHDQSTNLATITNYHNSQKRDLDVSIHFNAYQNTSKPMGTETLYITQSTLANQMSSAVAHCGFINRGGKKRTDLYFLNNTHMPAILEECCFVDSSADADIYRTNFDTICKAMATVLSGKLVRPANKRK